ncbi:ectoine hydroxylase [Tomitella biformata]|uniref:ectoine hydroxylase n=1 Tax=Tomitella biformata TaxID=630403 RepID=UPI0004B281B2|nr:ectoine hydroxylase [Tomitella biformata]
MTIADTGRVVLRDSSTVDLYPTRFPANEPARGGWIDRSDPTVWGVPGHGPVEAAELARHERDGYTVDDALLTAAEVREHRAELERLSADPALAQDERVIREPGSNAVRSIFEVHRISEAVSELARRPQIVDRARQLLGSEVYIHQSRVNFMPGFEGNGFYWHSDFETWHAEDGLPRPRAVSLSIALTDNYPHNGALMVIAGSQRHFLPCAGETPDENYRSSLVRQRAGVPAAADIGELAERYGIEQFTGAAGSALWFDSNIMHGSGSNITPYPRSNIFLVFNSCENMPQAPFAASQPRPTYIAARQPQENSH